MGCPPSAVGKARHQPDLNDLGGGAALQDPACESLV